jgi:uncharacterized delta-60 repeat protein
MTARAIRAGVALALIAFPAAAAAAAGDLDPSFDGNGKLAIDLGGNEGGGALALQPDGKLVLAGYSSTAGGFAVTRRQANGSPDAGFAGGTGVVFTDFGGSAVPYDAAIDSQGRIVLVGDVSPIQDFGVARVTPAGTPDGELAGDGTLLGDFGSSLAQGRGVFLYPDDRIGVVGNSGPGDYDFGVAVLTQTGVYSGFNTTGRMTIDFGTTFDLGADGELLPDGRIVVGGLRGGTIDCAAARVNPNGGLDGGFGTGGRAVLDLGEDEYCDTMAMDSVGRILFGGRRDTASSSDLLAARMTATGAPDPAFDGDGGATAGLDDRDMGHAVAVQPDDKVIVAGSTPIPGSDWLIARFNVNGGLDPTFGGGDGLVTTDFGGDDFPTDILVQPDGGIVVSGQTSAGDDLAIARYEGGPPPLSLELKAKRKQRAGKLKALLTCSVECQASARAKGRAGGEKFKTKLVKSALPAEVATKLKLKLKRADRADVVGERGRAKVIASAHTIDSSVTEKAKLKLKP